MNVNLMNSAILLFHLEDRIQLFIASAGPHSICPPSKLYHSACLTLQAKCEYNRNLVWAVAPKSEY